jgi:hypothetical protein
MKTAINALVFVFGMAYGLCAFVIMLGALFILGNNDTILEVLGILAAGFCAIPGVMIGLRHRRLAAVIFMFATSLWIIGVINAQFFIERKFGTPVVFAHLASYLLKISLVLMFFSAFYFLTDILKWPLLVPKKPSTIGTQLS